MKPRPTPLFLKTHIQPSDPYDTEQALKRSALQVKLKTMIILCRCLLSVLAACTLMASHWNHSLLFFMGAIGTSATLLLLVFFSLIRKEAQVNTMDC
jgi:hypothetical protein